MPLHREKGDGREGAAGSLPGELQHTPLLPIPPLTNVCLVPVPLERHCFLFLCGQSQTCMFWAPFNENYELRRKKALTFQEESKPKQPPSSGARWEELQEDAEGSPADLG